MLNFKEFLKIEEQNTVGTHNDGPGVAYLPSEFTGSAAPDKTLDARNLSSLEGKSHISNLDAVLPAVTKKGQIRLIEKNKNPIFILLSDGTQLYLSWDEFKRIHGQTPEVGKHLTVVFQRHLADQSKTPSKINSILCH
jgi:hypothetical protein